MSLEDKENIARLYVENVFNVQPKVDTQPGDIIVRFFRSYRHGITEEVRFEGVFKNASIEDVYQLFLDRFKGEYDDDLADEEEETETDEFSYVEADAFYVTQEEGPCYEGLVVGGATYNQIQQSGDSDQYGFETCYGEDMQTPVPYTE